MFNFLTEKGIEAVILIQRFWKRYFRKILFQRIKKTIEEWDNELPKRFISFLNPDELKIIQDLNGNVKIRFRLGGQAFPPTVYYKIFLDHQPVCSINGERLLIPGSKASYASCEIMGRVNYFKQVKLQLEYKISHKHYDTLDVANQLDFVKHLNSVDNTPALLGGTMNNWRALPHKYIRSVIANRDHFNARKKSYIARSSSINSYSASSSRSDDNKYRKTPKLIKKDKNEAKYEKLHHLQRLYGIIPSREKGEDGSFQEFQSLETSTASNRLLMFKHLNHQYSQSNQSNMYDSNVNDGDGYETKNGIPEFDNEFEDEFDSLFAWTNNLPIVENV